jgi:hypothetical protein
MEPTIAPVAVGADSTTEATFRLPDVLRRKVEEAWDAGLLRDQPHPAASPPASGDGAWASAVRAPNSRCTSARDFGRYVRKVVDRTPETVAGFASIAKFLRLDPTKRDVDELRKRVDALEVKPKRPHRQPKVGGRGVKIDVDYWLDRLERDVMLDIKKEGHQLKEARVEILERVYRLASKPMADAINNRYRKFNGGKNVLSASSIRRKHDSGVRGVEGPYISKRWAEWEKYRKGAVPDDTLADGSLKQDVEEDIKPVDPTRPKRPDEEGQEDNRLRSTLDGNLVGATLQEVAEVAVSENDLRMHEGGQGMGRLAPPTNEVEEQNDRDEQYANRFLAANGFCPHSVSSRRRPTVRD